MCCLECVYEVFKDGIWECVLRKFEGIIFGSFVFISLV